MSLSSMLNFLSNGNAPALQQLFPATAERAKLCEEHAKHIIQDWNIITFIFFIIGITKSPTALIVTQTHAISSNMNFMEIAKNSVFISGWLQDIVMFY